jgi:hypothetical protein
VSAYADGRRIEYAVTADLRENGYEIQRAASSKGVADVLAFKPGQVLMVSVKRTSMPGPGERADLLRVAGFLPGVAVPLVALGPVAKLRYRELVGVGPKEWRAWAPDYVEAIA